MYFWSYLNKAVWNNAFSYKERQKIWSECKLYIPKLLDDNIKFQNKTEVIKFLNENLQLWNKIVFEEVINWKLYSKSWLNKYLSFSFKNSKIHIFDNHNLAFYFITKYFQNTQNKLDLIHIDQHSDMRTPTFIPDILEDVEKYTFEWVNVWNYLIPLQKLWIIWKIYQCRTQTIALELDERNIENNILNIDLDFWEEKMATDYQSLEKIKKYIGISPIVLIATSPYFIEQDKALGLIYKLFE